MIKDGEYKVQYKHHTECALLINSQGKDIWFPRELIAINGSINSFKRNQMVTIYVSESLAEKKGLI